MYTLPLWDISVAGTASVTQGYPFPQQIAITTRGNQLADTNVFLVPSRRRAAPEPFVADFRVDKAFKFGGMRIIPSLDIFNLTNSSEILSRRRHAVLVQRHVRRGVVVDDAAAEQHQQHHRAARLPLRREGDLVGGIETARGPGSRGPAYRPMWRRPGATVASGLFFVLSRSFGRPVARSTE